MVDIDEFKKINDQHGHIAGDMILQEFAKLLLKGLPGADDWAARYGGEEFLLCLHDSDASEAMLNIGAWIFRSNTSPPLRRSSTKAASRARPGDCTSPHLQ